MKRTLMRIAAVLMGAIWTAAGLTSMTHVPRTMARSGLPPTTGAGNIALESFAFGVTFTAGLIMLVIGAAWAQDWWRAADRTSSEGECAVTRSSNATPVVNPKGKP